MQTALFSLTIYYRKRSFLKQRNKTTTHHHKPLILKPIEIIVNHLDNTGKKNNSTDANR
jgi:hypothetical protein